MHLCDVVLGDINRSIERGEVEIPAAINAFTAAGNQGHYSLELGIHNIDDADRPAQAGRYITSLLQG